MKSDRGSTTGAEAGFESGAVAHALAAHREGRHAGSSGFDMNDEESAELRSLLELAGRLDARLRPVRPSAAFVKSLREELVREAESRMAKREKRHRIAVISAAVAGGIVSIASLVGGILVLVKYFRTRSDAQQVSTA